MKEQTSSIITFKLTSMPVCRKNDRYFDLKHLKICAHLNISYDLLQAMFHRTKPSNGFLYHVIRHLISNSLALGNIQSNFQSLYICFVHQSLCYSESPKKPIAARGHSPTMTHGNNEIEASLERKRYLIDHIRTPAKELIRSL
jgi:hypothetical protein